MRTPIAVQNLLHQKMRTLIAMVGIGFALVLMFMQLGFLGALITSATQLYNRLEFDAVILSRQYLDMNRARVFPRDRLDLARSVAGVKQVLPVGLGYQLWKTPPVSLDPMQTPRITLRTMMMLAVDPDRPETFRRAAFDRPEEIDAALPRIRTRSHVVIDRLSRPEFGPQTAGIQANLGREIVTIAGQFQVGTGFGADGLILVSMDTYRQILGIDPREQVNLGLIQLESPEQLATCLPRLQAEMPPDVQILSRDELFTKEQRHWIQGTSIGIIFVLGVLVAFVVGVVFVYQVMSSDITSRLGEFATLKAMGYTNGFIGRVVLQQAAFLAILSYLISLVLAVGLYELTRQLAGLPMQMTWQILVMVLLLGLGMCSLSGLIALQKVRRADPADLF